MDFKTNAKCQGCVSAIIDAARKQFPDAQYHLDLDTVDKVLHVHGIPEDAETAAKIEQAIQATGFQGSWIQPL